MVGEAEDDLPGVPMLVGPTVSLWCTWPSSRWPTRTSRLAAFADALDQAARPESGPVFETLAKALGELGQEADYLWPEGDAATVARWVRQALSPVLHSPFEGPRGAADHELLSVVLRRAEGGDRVALNQDEAGQSDA
ncbi:hypothetical protein [Streptomyces albipurpureus]|uniref:Uncharacterized protein n=1 Tax=Streptomyces albipurpureus TaxID=2897419 RepID=A0ABT0UKL2_9ACTN|nr:hypothetical protein [Streptomyces sp. CWNU-1]MCM2388761.1 hypothetical protein [Streptomyces sp. CWNU-1]